MKRGTEVNRNDGIPFINREFINRGNILNARVVDQYITVSAFLDQRTALFRFRHIGLTKTTALETAEQPITANAICPGYVLTPLVEAQIPATMEKYDMDRDEVIKKVMLERQPSREFATVEQLGGTCVFLSSPAADQITGTTISVDGGWTAL